MDIILKEKSKLIEEYDLKVLNLHFKNKLFDKNYREIKEKHKEEHLKD